MIATRRRRLSAALYAYEFFTNAIPLYPLYVLLFTDAGLSTAEVSSILATWVVASMLLEIPSGVWADQVSRRLLLCVAPLLAGAGFALWSLVPGYWSFALGAVLWGAQGALKSGAQEALVYEELGALGAADRYATVLGRARTVEVFAVTGALLAAGPVLAYGGYLAIGVTSVVACGLATVAAAAFPEHRRDHAAADHSAADHPGTDHAAQEHPVAELPAAERTAAERPAARAGGYLATLRAGVTEVRTDRRVLLAVLAIPAVATIWGDLEEYVPLLATEVGVPATTVPLYVLAVWAGITAGGLLAGFGRTPGGNRLSIVVIAAAGLLAAGALSGVRAGFVLIALAFCLFQLVTVAVEARLQHLITGPSRATVTSVASLGSGVASLASYGVYAAAAGYTRHGVIFAALMVPYLLAALGFRRSWAYTEGKGPEPGTREPATQTATSTKEGRRGGLGGSSPRPYERVDPTRALRG
ncbi:MAG: MFS transporter [Micromonosporaceae bacterium]